MKIPQFTNTTYLSLFYLLLTLGVIYHMSGLITSKPVINDAEQNLTMAYHLYKSGVLSNSRVDIETPIPSNYREPVPPTILAIGMYLHPGINQDTSFQSIQNGDHTKTIKQVNFFWILLLLTGVGYLTYILSKNKFLPFLSLFLTVVYFIRFGNHFDNLNTELPAAALIIWLSCVLVLMHQRKKISLYVLGGFLLGLLILTKGVFLYLSIVTLLYVLFLSYQEKSYLKFSLFFVGALLLVTPWLVRNYGIYNEFSLTQRGGAVLHLRAMHNQMTGEEVIGAFYFWGPEIYKDLFRDTPMGAHESDFEVGGKYQRLNRDLAIDTLAVDIGYPEMAISFYNKSRAEINRLQNVLGDDGREGDRYDAYAIMESNAKRMILDKPFKHAFLSVVYFWRGIWCFPDSTIPLLNNTLQSYLHNTINLIAYTSLYIFLVSGFLRRRWLLVGFTITPVSMLLMYALLTNNIARFSEPAIPSMIVGFSLLVFLVKEKAVRRLSA